MTKPEQAGLRKRIRMCVAALASSGDNFRVAGETLPVSDELQEEYTDSFVSIVEATCLEVIGGDIQKTKEVEGSSVAMYYVNKRLKQQRQALSKLLVRGEEG